MKYPKRSQYKYAKSQSRVRNWPEYEAGLKKRGDLTVWLSVDPSNPTEQQNGSGSITYRVQFMSGICAHSSSLWAIAMVQIS
jgi:hypothetical protein